MLGILFSWLSPLRFIGIWIDTIAFSLIDNAYNLIVTFSSGTLLKQEFVENLMDNFYVIIGIFALFRVAILLVNSMINPDKLSEKGNGLSNVLVNFLVMFVLLVMTPVIFKEAIDLQEFIVKGNYVQKLFINADALEDKDPGKAMRSIAIGSLITIDKEALEMYENGKCSKNCEKAIEDYREMEKDGFSFPTISKHIGVSVKNDDGDTVYVYNYMFLVTFAAGCFIAYVLFSFAIDIAVRMVELTVLQILAPLFIATYIDPKSAKSGSFHNWLTTVGKTYASLFIKLAILALMLLLVSIVGNLDHYAENLDLSGFEKLILLIAVLIFAKKAPKWITEMIGIKSEGLGGLGIGKKLGGAALIGGAASKGIESAKKFGAQKAKNFGANRLRNTAARIGGMKEANQDYKNRKKNGTLSPGEDNFRARARTMWQQGRGAAKKSRADNWGADAKGIIKDATAGYMAGRLNINPTAESIFDKMKSKSQTAAMNYNTKIGNTQEELNEKADAAKKLKKANQIRTSEYRPKEGVKRDAKKNWQGYNEFKNAIGSTVLTEDQAYINDALNQDSTLTYNATTKTFSNGMTLEQYKNTFTGAGQKDIAAYVAKNFQAQSDTLQANVQLRISNDEKISGYQAQVVQLEKSKADADVSINNLTDEINALISSGTPMTDPKVVALQNQKTQLITTKSAADASIAQLTNQINQLNAQNGMVNGESRVIINNLQASEKTFEKAPHKCPTAVQQGNDYVTAVGIFRKNPDGTFTYIERTEASDETTFVIDPRIVNEVANKVANVASSKDSEAQEAHSAMEPKN